MAPPPLPPLYAHRLGRAYGPDSSAVALLGALAGGALAGVETDVCLTADARVLLHDPYRPLGTDREGFAHERTARALRRTRLQDCEGRLTAERYRCSSTTRSPRHRRTSSSSSGATPRKPG